MPRVKTKLVTWEEVVEWSRQLAENVRASGYSPDVVVAVARGGYVPARLLCDFLDIHDLLSLQILHWGRAAEITAEAHVKYPYTLSLTGKRVLIVDDIVDTGDSVIVAKEFILKNWKPLEARIAAMQWISPVAKIKPDYFVEEVKEWVWYQYPWTRAEDTTNFLEKIVRESAKEGRLSWTKEDLIKAFQEWYGIDVGPAYYEIAIARLQASGILKKEGAIFKVVT